MDSELNEEHKRILAYLVDERKRNPETSVKGVPDKVVGANVGAFLNNVKPQLLKLQLMGLVNQIGNRVMITHKGIAYVQSHKLEFSSSDTVHRPNPLTWFRDHIVVALLVTIIGGLVVALLLQQC